MSTTSWVRSAAAVAVLTGVLTACAGADSTDAAARPASRGDGDPGAAATATAPASAKPVDQPAPSALANFVCERKPDGRWRARGDLINDSRRPVVLTVTVVTVDAGEQVIGEKIERFRLEPEQSQRFHWPRFHRGGAASCLPRVMRRPA